MGVVVLALLAGKPGAGGGAERGICNDDGDGVCGGGGGLLDQVFRKLPREILLGQGEAPVLEDTLFLESV